jgi:hypothetical protein
VTLGRARTLFILWIGVPFVVSVALIGPGLLQVAGSGMCPPAPPDVGAYPCSVGAYLLRMTLGPWALMGHILLWTIWTVVFVGWFGLLTLLRRRPASPRATD